MENSEFGADRIDESLRLLADLGRDFAASLDIDQTLLKAINKITEYMDAEGGALFLLVDDGERLRCEACVGATEIELANDYGIVGRSVQEGKGEIVRDVSQDPSFDGSVDEQTGFTTRSILCAPLSISEEKIGAIELINKRGGDGLFDKSDLHLLENLASSAALAIHNARMAQELVEQEKLQRELELAAEIQRNLLPPDPDEKSPIFGVNVPARTVSGDFFDFFTLEDGRIAFCLGDVSGKGMNAALLMAKTASLFRCLGKSLDNPGKLLARINEEICETATRGMFVTMAAGIFDPQTKKVVLANAGHEPPLQRTGSNQFVSFEADAPPVGISPFVVPDDGYPEIDVSLADGPLYIFTDGVTEGSLEDGSMLEIDGVKQILEEHGKLPLPARLAKFKQIIDRGDGKLHDDLTILGLDCAEDLKIPNLEIQVEARARSLKTVRDLVQDWMATERINQEITQDMILAIDEACQNIIRHAYQGETDQEIHLEINRENGRQIDELHIYLKDFAEPVDFSKIKPRKLDDVRPGGLGTHFIQEVMDEVEYSRLADENCNLLSMTKVLE